MKLSSEMGYSMDIHQVTSFHSAQNCMNPQCPVVFLKMISWFFKPRGLKYFSACALADEGDPLVILSLFEINLRGKHEHA